MKIFNKENFSKKNLVRVGKVVLVTAGTVVAGVLIYSKLNPKPEEIGEGLVNEEIIDMEESDEINNSQEEA